MTDHRQDEHDGSIASKILQVQELCVCPNHAEAATYLIHDRLVSLQQVLGALREPVTDGKRLQDLYDALEAIQGTIAQVLSMNRIVYLAKALKVQDALETGLVALTQSLESLLETQSPDAQKTFTLERKSYQFVCADQACGFQTLRDTLQNEQSGLVFCGNDQEFAAVLELLIGAVSNEEIAQARNVLRYDYLQLSAQIKKDVDPKARGQVIQFQGFLGVILDRLDRHPQLEDNLSPEASIATTKAGEESSTSDYPDWSLDPVTRQPMEHPVVLRAPCEHTMDKTTFVEYIVEKGNGSCPVCQAKLKGMSARPNKELAQRIQSLMAKKETVLPVNSNSFSQPVLPGSGMDESMQSLSLHCIEEESSVTEMTETSHESWPISMEAAAQILEHAPVCRNSPTSNGMRSSRRSSAARIQISFTSPQQHPQKKLSKASSLPTIVVSNPRPRPPGKSKLLKAVQRQSAPGVPILKQTR